MSTPPSPNAPGNRAHTPSQSRRSGVRLQTRALAGAVLASALALSGCAGPAIVTSVQRQAPEPVGESRSGGIIRYAHLQEPHCVYGGWIQEDFTARQVLDSLTSQNEQGEVVPWIARAWEVSDDGLAWTFHLREGVHFTDGTPLDAQAVEDNFQYWADGGNSTAAVHLGGFFESAEVADAHTVRVHLLRPNGVLPSTLSQTYFGLQSPTALRTRSKEDNCRQPIGSGPFTVTEFQRGSHISYARNPDYQWAPADARHQGPAYVDGIRWSFVPDNTSRYGALLSGEADAIGEVPAVNVAEAQERFAYQQYVTPGRPVVMSLNTREGIFTDVRVRKAFAHATDRESIVRSAFLGTVPFEPNGFISRTTPGYDPTLADALPYDADAANRLLDEAGWTGRDPDGVRTKDGRRLQSRIVYGAGSILNPDGATAVASVAEQARAVGFDLEIRPATQSELFGGLFATPETRGIEVGYWTSPHAGILHINYRPSTPEEPNGANTSFLDSPETYSTVVDALSARSEEQRNALFAQAQHELNDHVPAIGLYDQTNSVATSRGLTGVWLEGSQGAPVFHDAYFVAPAAPDGPPADARRTDQKD